MEELVVVELVVVELAVVASAAVASAVAAAVLSTDPFCLEPLPIVPNLRTIELDNQFQRKPSRLIATVFLYFFT